MKKKIISTLLCTAMLATMVAGCGVEKSDGGSDTEGLCKLRCRDERNR